ncbi:glycosyltransferase [Asaia krungthepensis]|nr:glycosyltransferase [Asaia krungthepensis]
MRIALIAHPRHPIAPPFKGGMEAHSYHLAKGLMARGHDVTLFAAGDSASCFDIDPIMPVHYDRDYPWENTTPHPDLYTMLDHHFGAAKHRIFSGRYDVVHNNCLHRFIMQEAHRTNMPCVTSLHVPPFEAIHGVVRDTLCATHIATVTSARQNWSWWGAAPPLESVVVHNGIDLDLWPAPDDIQTLPHEEHALWCGRITRNKGPHHAVQAARKAGLGLRLYGYLEDRDYFAQEIQPWLDERILYGGVADGTTLSRAMRQARLLFFTPCWDEPFGLVAVEAMASGLPIACFDQGAAREIIGEEAGRYARPNDVNALAQAAHDAMQIGRDVPRKRVEACFSQERMIDAYEALYARVRAASDHLAPMSQPYETLIL